MINSPCDGCHDRTSTCHAECLRYKEFRKTLEENYEKRSGVRKRDNIVNGYQVSAIQKSRKHSNKKKKG